MSAADAQFLEGRKFQRSEIAMFFGVPPFLLGDVEKTTSWGSGIDSMGTAFVQYTAQDWITMWEQSIVRDLLDPRPRPGRLPRRRRPDARRHDRPGFYYARALGSGGGRPDDEVDVRFRDASIPWAAMPPSFPLNRRRQAADGAKPEDKNAPDQ
jgi:hypothetical protein